ncbi:unnamed protein product [Phaedon cochleariae]|uniref:Anaphase-promoting complex subunit 4-like WD40 domain-containing protein n=1 Tax=Phaedon cochleariae TaxID=80249 RepID=A0A9P0DMR8_PHACE|nr:unnamed protein product [Phaedon cochleariae]
MSHCKMHNVRFYNPEPRAIRCMALQDNTKKLAISRSDASIEIWNLNNVWFSEHFIASTTENFSIEGLAWCGNRLFSVGLHGLLIEYNILRLCLGNRWAVTGEAAYCLDVNKTNSRIAVGTEQGYLNISRVEEDGLSFEKFFDKQEGKIICLKFSHDGEFVVSGSVDAIRVWNVTSGHAIHKMTTGRSETNKATIVWCLEVTNDFTIISGDSRGKLTFWDGKVGSQIESYQSHRADILAICLSENQTYLCCAGADPNIITYEMINVKDGARKWVKSIQRKIHEHDVNALIILDNKLYSGGADSYLACSYHPPKTLLKLPPLQNPSIQISAASKYLLLQYPKHVELWRLGRTRDVEASYRGFLTLEKDPKKLLVLQRTTKDYDGDKEREGVICSSMSKDGQWLLFSTNLGVSLFQFSCEDDKPVLLKIDDLDESDVPCLRAVFSPDNSQLITAPNIGGLLLYHLQEDKASISQRIVVEGLTDSVSFLNITNCGKYLIVGDASSNIVIFSWYRNKQWTHHCKLPKYKFPPTAMAAHPTTLCLVVVYSDNKIVEYDLKKRHFTNFSKQLENTDLKSRMYPIRNITFDPRAENIILLHDDNSIIIFNKGKAQKSPKKTKIPKVESADSVKENGVDKPYEGIRYQVNKRYKHLAHLEWLADDEIVAVEVNPLALMEQLPPAFAQNTFGRK